VEDQTKQLSDMEGYVSGEEHFALRRQLVDYQTQL
jgi:hypothetical protein